MPMPSTEEPKLPPRPDTACPSCAHVAQHNAAPGSGPHAYRLDCESCGSFIKWLPKTHKGAITDGT
jgi:hypothetical protein